MNQPPQDQSPIEGDPAAQLRPADKDVLKIWPVSKEVKPPRTMGLNCWMLPVRINTIH
jgi:hypothetical protein